MEKEIYEPLGDLVIKAGNDIKTGNCVLNEEQSIMLLSLIAHLPVSKETARTCLNISTSKFDTNVRMKKFPKGRKRRGFKELHWYIDELTHDRIKLLSILKRLKD